MPCRHANYQCIVRHILHYNSASANESVVRPPQRSVRMGTPNRLAMDVPEMALIRPAAASVGIPLNNAMGTTCTMRTECPRQPKK